VQARAVGITSSSYRVKSMVSAASAQDILAGRISWEQLDARARGPALLTEIERKMAPERQVGHPFNPEDVIRASAGYGAQIGLVHDLLRARAKYGEAAALVMAGWTAKLPVLWKAK